MTQIRSTGKVITFYSYKGGVGRTFLMANVAVLLAKWGKRVLCIDWDLEAPGLHRYFDSHATLASQGLLELICDPAREPDWREHVAQVRLDGVLGQLDLMAAGSLDDSYVSRVQKVDWDDMYEHADLGTRLERLRAQWVADYDFVLLDSRTGITDIGGICAAQLPDILAFLFTANHQSLDGCLDAVRRAAKQRATLPVARGGFLTLPIPSRFDGREEYEQGRAWMKIFADTLDEFYKPWRHENVSPNALLDLLRVPYMSYWSFGERLPVTDERLSDPDLISYSIATIGAFLATSLGDSGELVRDRNGYVAQFSPEAEHVTTSGGRQIDFLVHGDLRPVGLLLQWLRGFGANIEDSTPRVGARIGNELERKVASASILLVVVGNDLGDDRTGRILVKLASERNMPVVPIFSDSILSYEDLWDELRMYQGLRLLEEGSFELADQLWLLLKSVKVADKKRRMEAW